MLFVSRQKRIEARIEEYRGTLLECVQECMRAIAEHCRKPDHERVKENFAEVHRLESRADDIRRDIEVMMYSKALFPESRGDVLGLLEAMDKVPNHAESGVRGVYEQHLVVPEPFQSQLINLLDVCERCVTAMVESVRKLFADYANAVASVGEIDRLESEADHAESALKEAIFASDLDGLRKILLRDLVSHMSGICDRVETVGDRIRIMVAKRGI